MNRDSRRRFIAKGVVSFFALLVPFLAVSNYFGGGAIGIATSMIISSSVATVLFLSWPRLSRREGHQPQVPGPIYNQPCPPGPYSVSPGKLTKIQLGVREGDTLDGHVEEVGGYNFSWFIVDEENLIHYLNDERFNPSSGETEVAASKVRFKAPNDGPWYLLFDASGKQVAREVEAHLRIL